MFQGEVAEAEAAAAAYELEGAFCVVLPFWLNSHRTSDAAVSVSRLDRSTHYHFKGISGILRSKYNLEISKQNIYFSIILLFVMTCTRD
jgi:hypothetical protein